MPEHIRALLVILFLAGTVFLLIKPSATRFITREGFIHWSGLWFGLTLSAFLSGNYWVYVLIAALGCRLAVQRGESPLALFFLLLLVIPAVPVDIPGFGVINFLFTLNQPRLLSLVLLLPLFLQLRNQPDTLRFGRLAADRLLLAYLLLVALLGLRPSVMMPWSFTNLLREWAMLFIDVFLPYYVASRSLRNLQQFKTVLFAFVLTTLVLALIGSIEFAKSWLLYNALLNGLDLQWDILGYLGRSGLLRASASAGHAIALGYVMMVAIGFYLFLQQGLRFRIDQFRGGSPLMADLRNKLFRLLGLGVLLAGLLAPLSRGPWLGTALLFLLFTLTGRHALRGLLQLLLAALLALPLLTALPGGEKILNLLPFVGQVEKENIDYREQLLHNSLMVIGRQPLFGSPDALREPEMEAMRQGQGIIDVVNSYIAIALDYGLIALALFMAFFALIFWQLLTALRRLPDQTEESWLLGRALFATLGAVLFTIFTVSSITIIPVIYWSLAGLTVGYIVLTSSKSMGYQPPEDTPGPSATAWNQFDKR